MAAKRTFLKVLSLLAITAATTIAAKADTYDFTLTGEGNTYTFSLPSSPTPFEYSSDGFDSADIHIMADGTAEVGEVGFYTNPPSTLGGMFVANVSIDIIALGPQLFTGPTSSPTFILGDFNLTENDGAPYTIDITDATTSPVPEPTSLALLATGTLAFLG